MSGDFRPVVLINTWNQARWLRACIESVLAQYPPASEIIVHDDGSSDGTDVILRSYGSRIRILRSEREPPLAAHLRQARAIEASFATTIGDPVFLLDGDDLFRPGKIAAFLTAFSSPELPMLVQSPLQWVDSEGMEIPTLDESFRHCTSPLTRALASNKVDLFYPTSALAFRREFLLRSLPLDYSHGCPLWPDSVLSLGALAGGSIATLPEAWGCRRIHPSSDSAARQRNRFHLVRQTLDKATVFNHFARRSGIPTINPWLNASLLLQILGSLLPNTARRLRARFRLYPAPKKT